MPWGTLATLATGPKRWAAGSEEVGGVDRDRSTVDVIDDEWGAVSTHGAPRPVRAA